MDYIHNRNKGLSYLEYLYECENGGMLGPKAYINVDSGSLFYYVNLEAQTRKAKPELCLLLQENVYLINNQQTTVVDNIITKPNLNYIKL